MKLSLYNLRKGFRYLKNYGLKEFFIRLKEKGEPEQISYAEYAALTFNPPAMFRNTSF